MSIRRLPETRPPAVKLPAARTTAARWPLPARTVLARGLPAVALAALAVLVVGVPPAAAHGQQVLISLEAAAGGDGTAAVTEITAVVRYRGDGHPVPGAVLATTAVSGGQQVSVELAAAGEPGTYTGTAELPPGTWEITTEATGDHTGTAVTEATVAEPAPITTTAPPTTAPPATTDPANATATGAGTSGEPTATGRTEPTAADAGTSPLLIAAPVALVALGAAILLGRRLRRT